MCQWCSWWGLPEMELKELEPPPADAAPRPAFEAAAVEADGTPSPPAQGVGE